MKIIKKSLKNLFKKNQGKFEHYAIDITEIAQQRARTLAQQIDTLVFEKLSDEQLLKLVAGVKNELGKRNIHTCTCGNIEVREYGTENR